MVRMSASVVLTLVMSTGRNGAVGPCLKQWAF
jgi:hypothetical protein